MTDERQPEFKRGDLVRHKSSGEVAIVTCRLSTGDYEISLGFEDDTTIVDEIVLEHSPADDSGEW